MQLVLDSEIVTAGGALFDVEILGMAGIDFHLYCANKYASDNTVLQLYSSDIISNFWYIYSKAVFAKHILMCIQ